MTNVHLFFLKLFGCMLCEAKANGHEVPIDIAPFSQAIMTARPHPEVHLQFGRCDGAVGRSNLHCWKTEHGSVLAGWLYELDSIAISVLFAQAAVGAPGRSLAPALSREFQAPSDRGLHIRASGSARRQAQGICRIKARWR
jgi:hypothetical protein